MTRERPRWRWSKFSCREEKTGQGLHGRRQRAAYGKSTQDRLGAADPGPADLDKSVVAATTEAAASII